jgi:hypothetical protein
VLDERVKGQVFGWARNPNRMRGPFGPPASSLTDGRWTYSEWRFSGEVYNDIALLDAGWQAGERYRFRPVSGGTRRAECSVTLRHRTDREMLEGRVKIGPEKEACLQLLYPELRLDR